jgi:hypothetical protein
MNCEMQPDHTPTGDLTPTEANDVTRFLDAYVKAFEAAELNEKACHPRASVTLGGRRASSCPRGMHGVGCPSLGLDDESPAQDRRNLGLHSLP